MVEPLDIPTVSQTWPSSVITLVLGAFLLPMGRLADMYGAFYVFSGGLIWYVLWAVIAGFSRNFIMLVVCRAMEGLGAAAILPAGVCILGRTYSPGPRKNLVYGLYGCVGPFGYFLGTVVGGLAVKLLTWRWYFWAGAIMLTLSCIGVILTGPRDYKQAREMNVKMDWLGTCTIIPGLMLLVYAITDSSRQPKGWLAPQILTCVIIGILLLVGAVYIEGWVATAPLIPPEMFRVKYMKRIILCLLLSWGSFSILIFYANF
jgi:MFS family permease